MKFAGWSTGGECYRTLRTPEYDESYRASFEPNGTCANAPRVQVSVYLPYVRR